MDRTKRRLTVPATRIPTSRMLPESNTAWLPVTSIPVTPLGSIIMLSVQLVHVDDSTGWTCIPSAHMEIGVQGQIPICLNVEGVVVTDGSHFVDFSRGSQCADATGNVVEDRTGTHRGMPWYPASASIALQ